MKKQELLEVCGVGVFLFLNLFSVVLSVLGMLA